MRTDSLVIASNRGPVSWRQVEGGLAPRRGFGGLVTALGGALQDEPGTWVSLAMNDNDREVAASHPDTAFTVEVEDHTFNLRLLDVGERFDPYYNAVSNRLLWFTLHDMWNPPYEPAESRWSADWHDGYEPVNNKVADAIVDAAGARPEIHLHDYHLMRVGPHLRRQLPNIPILHYVHTPWPRPRELGYLPDTVAEGILRGLLTADLVALSAPEWASALRRCAAEIVDAELDGEVVTLDGHRTVVTDFVLGVDEQDLASSAADEATLRAGAALDEQVAGRKLILRVDRTDLSKNIMRGLLAYELLLERHPEHLGTVWHYAHLNPSRQGVPAYRAYLDACRAAVERITKRFGEDAVGMYVGDDYPKAVAGLQRYDVLLTNPVRDGTNLVAKEGPTLNQRDGVLVLSREAGAATMLASGALVVNPFDVEDQAEALHQALVMPAAERSERADQLQAAARLGAPHDWFLAQRSALHEAVQA